MSNTEEPQKPILDEVMAKKQDEEIASFNPGQLVTNLLKPLPERSRNILSRRFGLEGSRKQTLEELGQTYNITRERVRQIESSAIKTLKKSAKTAALEPAFRVITKILNENGDVMSEDDLLEKIFEQNSQSTNGANDVIFIMKLTDRFGEFDQNVKYKRAWALAGHDLGDVERVTKQAITILKQEEKALTGKDLLAKLKASPELSNMTDEAVLSYLTISRRIQQNPYGEWGLLDWREIVPRGVRDKAYLVMRKHNQPLHFTKITEEINKRKFDHRKAHPQTVHNELIKDKRFVLVGRGIYALKEWGYKPGTVADVLARIITKADGPVNRDELVNAVLKERLVRKNTVLIGLQDKDKFKKVGDNQYDLVQKD